ncbi:MAG: T9SS type A sorting domain-containing protein [Thermoanaerobaculia bacterium]|nr:T9SS type A sorting domain-containing protein [Thermoanaerobaculia bacterium]
MLRLPAIFSAQILLLPCLFAQSDTILFAPLSVYPYPAPFSAYTARFDRLHRPYLYTANKEYGVIVFSYSNPLDLKPVRTITVQQFQNLKPTDLVQQGNYLYVSLGEFQGLFTQSAGLAVIDISDPENAVIVGQWSDPAFNKGAAAVRVGGSYAYLGAMEKGLIVLDVSKADDPKYISHAELDLNWPVPPGLFSVPHARGLALRGNEVWVCFDAGGLRLVDVSDKQNPMETAKYMNVALDAVAQPAYNTATIVGNYLYATVDYCGLDVVDITKPVQPVSAAWLNPWNCTNTSWDGSPGHTNQVATARHDSLLFVTGGDTEVIAYSISNPELPRQNGQFAHLKDSVVVWGLDVNDSLVVLAQVWNPLNTPYIGKKGGISLLRWNAGTTTAGHGPEQADFSLRIFPNPLTDAVKIRYELPVEAHVRWQITDMLGKMNEKGNPGLQPIGAHSLDLPIKEIPAGVYFFTFWADERVLGRLIVKN